MIDQYIKKFIDFECFKIYILLWETEMYPKSPIQTLAL